MKKLCFAAVAALLAACGGNEPTTGSDVGSLNVQVLASAVNEAAPAELDTIVVTLSGPETKGATLTRQNGTFSHQFEELLVGTYSVVATGYDVAGQAIFFSTATNVDVVKDTDGSVVVVMNERDPDAEPVLLPKFLSLTVSDLTPEQQVAIDIAVTTERATKMWGKYGNFMAGTTAVTEAAPVLLTNGAGAMTWTAPSTPGMAWFIVIVQDDAGNTSEMGVTVWVGPDRGFETGIEFNYNLAPTATFKVRQLNDRDAATYYIWVTPTDTTPIAYAWTAAAGENCTFIDKPTSAPLSGTIVPATETYFKIEVPNAVRVDPTCVLKLTLTDAGSASSIYSLTLQDELVGPDADHEGDVDLTNEFPDRNQL